MNKEVMNILKVSEYSDELLDAINWLLPQLTPSARPLTPDKLTEVIRSECSHLFVAVSDNKIIGMLTLVMFCIPTGTRAWIEDVVVAEEARGQGAGKQLVSEALDLAKSLKAGHVNLTSRSSREAANMLYRRLGFKDRETNVYYHKFS